MDLEGIDHVIEVMSCNYPAGTEENHIKPQVKIAGGF
jgi:hypothetical protein